MAKQLLSERTSIMRSFNKISVLIYQPMKVQKGENTNYNLELIKPGIYANERSTPSIGVMSRF